MIFFTKFRWNSVRILYSFKKNSNDINSSYIFGLEVSEAERAFVASVSLYLQNRGNRFIYETGKGQETRSHGQ